MARYQNVSHIGKVGQGKIRLRFLVREQCLFDKKTFISSLSHPNMYNSESLKKSESGLNVRLNLSEYSGRSVRIEYFDSGKPTQG